MAFAAIPSRSQLKKAAERVCKGLARPGDHGRIAAYRDLRCLALLPATSLVGELTSDGTGVFTARLKRYESIVRKIIRLRTEISRMEDIVGVRVIVDSRAKQDAIVEGLRRSPLYHRTQDYLDQGREDGYRAAHIVLHLPVTGPAQTVSGLLVPVEVQVRTYYQHLWASVSESLGQQVKEGGGSVEARSYLQELSAFLAEEESGLSDQGARSWIGTADEPRFLLVNFNLQWKRLESVRDLGSDRDAAIEALRVIEASHQQTSEFESVLLCSPHEDVVRYTHIRYYPATLLAELLDRTGAPVPDWALSDLLGSRGFAA